MRNKLHYSFLFCVSLVGSLLLLDMAPAVTIGEWTFKKVDFLSGVQRPDKQIEKNSLNESASVDSTHTTDDLRPQDSIANRLTKCPSGLTCIEDYSADSTALVNLFSALLQSKKVPVRIAFFGDSFIEGDVFCGSVRDSLQSIFGGEGVGFVPITSNVTGFRKTIKHSFGDWETYSLTGKRDKAISLGPAGLTFIPDESNYVEYQATKLRFLRNFHQFKFYYQSEFDNVINYELDTITGTDVLPATTGLSAWQISAKSFKSGRFEIVDPQRIFVYGASFENGPGVYVDNFSLRGNSGMGLTSVPRALYTAFNDIQDYKLVVLQFGLNLVVEDGLNYEAYTSRMAKVIRQLQSYFPQSSFLLLGVSDRSSNTTGSFQTMKAIHAMRDAQREIARQTGIAFWDVFIAMGGENSMIDWVHADPPLAAKDYTHLNFNGGNRLSGKFVKSLLFDFERFKNMASTNNPI